MAVLNLFKSVVLVIRHRGISGFGATGSASADRFECIRIHENSYADPRGYEVLVTLTVGPATAELLRDSATKG